MAMIKASGSGGVFVFDTNDVLLAVTNHGSKYHKAGGTLLYFRGSREMEIVIDMEPDVYAAIACAGFEHLQAAATIVS